jgi:hypothetical protein
MTAISNAQRAALRRAIASHADWPAYRRTHGVDTASLGSARAVDVARHLGLNVEAIIGAEAAATVEDATVTYTAPTAPAGLFDNRRPVATAAPAPATGGVDVAALSQTITAAIAGALAGSNGASAEALAALDARVSDLEAAAPALLVIDRDGKPHGAELPPSRHPLLAELIRAVSARKATDGGRLHVWIAGPAGSGKTTAARQAAEALGLEFAAHGAMGMAHELIGFVDAGGAYHEPAFVRLYRNGGLCLLDEMDASDANVTLVMNGALDNGHMQIPTGEMVARHPDFACIATGNTFGAGATAEYVGRNKLDGAFLKRFVAMEWPYDEKLETAICGNPDFAARVQRARKAAAKAGLKVLITPRDSVHGAALIAAGFDADTAARMTYLTGLSAAQVAQVEAGA